MHTESEKYIDAFDHQIDSTKDLDTIKAKKAGVSTDTYIRFKKNIDKVSKIRKVHGKSTALKKMTKLHPDLSVPDAHFLKKRRHLKHRPLNENNSDQTNQTNQTDKTDQDAPDMTGLSGPALYRCGGHGMIQWVDDFVRIPIYVDDIPYWISMAELPTKKNPHTGRSSADFWDAQKPILKEALRMVNNKFVYRLVVLCWMRGDGKSLLACLIQLWKFFNFPRQQIMLGANSKDQVKFVHFDIMRDIILNSPKLLRIVGKKNVQEKEIRLRDGKGNVVSIIRSISSFSGIVSNITGYTFSEIFDMKNPKFFTQLDGSIRNIPNALGVIDSTVSAKDHVLFRLYDNSRRKIDELTYFSYRSSPEASAADYWHPEMTQSQLNSYKTKFPPAEFDMYFKNVWESASHKMFLPNQIQAMQFIGVDGQLGNNDKILQYCADSIELEQKKEKLLNDGNEFGYEMFSRKSDPIKRCDSIERIYTLQTSYFQNKPASLGELHALEDVYDTHFVIGAGVDRADPMKINITRGARSIVCVIAKGLPGSRTHPELYMQKENQTLRYFYFLLGLFHIPRNDLASIQEVLDESIDRYDGIESLSTERWGMWDIADWCVDNNIYFDPLTASYMKQKEGFAELFTLMADGRFKSPPLAVPGTNGGDILREEMTYFDHDPLTKFYGSPEKNQSNGVQDDSMFALNWGIYGMRFLGLDYMRERGAKNKLGSFFENRELEGIY